MTHLIVDAYSLRSRLDYGQLISEMKATTAIVFSQTEQYPRKFLDKLKFLGAPIGLKNECHNSPEAMYAALAAHTVDISHHDPCSFVIVSESPAILPVLWCLVNHNIGVTFISRMVPDSLAKKVTFIPCGNYLFTKPEPIEEPRF